MRSEAISKMQLIIKSCQTRDHFKNCKKWIYEQFQFLNLTYDEKTNIFKSLLQKDTEIKVSFIKNLQVTTDMNTQIAKIITNDYKKTTHECLYHKCNRLKGFTVYQTFKIFYEVASIFWGKTEADKLLEKYSDRF